MSKEIKSKISLAKEEASTVIESFVQLVEAVSLIVVSGFAIYQAKFNGQGQFWVYPVLIAGAVIAVRASIEFLKYLKRK